MKLVLSTVINSSNSNKCHIYNSDNKNETNLLFDRIQVARNCHFQICFKLNNCENYADDPIPFISLVSIIEWIFDR